MIKGAFKGNKIQICGVLGFKKKEGTDYIIINLKLNDTTLEYVDDGSEHYIRYKKGNDTFIIHIESYMRTSSIMKTTESTTEDLKMNGCQIQIRGDNKFKGINKKNLKNLSKYIYSEKNNVIQNIKLNTYIHFIKFLLDERLTVMVIDNLSSLLTKRMIETQRKAEKLLPGGNNIKQKGGDPEKEFEYLREFHKIESKLNREILLISIENDINEINDEINEIVYILNKIKSSFYLYQTNTVNNKYSRYYRYLVKVIEDKHNILYRILDIEDYIDNGVGFKKKADVLIGQLKEKQLNQNLTHISFILII